MSSLEESRKLDYLRDIREMCGYIIHHTHSYINDGDIRRMILIENETRNIQELVDKVRECSHQIDLVVSVTENVETVWKIGVRMCRTSENSVTPQTPPVNEYPTMGEANEECARLNLLEEDSPFEYYIYETAR